MKEVIEKIEYPKMVEGKSPDRVHKAYLKYPKDWIAQYDMLLPDGLNCTSCHHCNRCCSMFGQKPTHDYCQFYPSRYLPLPQTKEANDE